MDTSHQIVDTLAPRAAVIEAGRASIAQRFTAWAVDLVALRLIGGTAFTAILLAVHGPVISHAPDALVTSLDHLTLALMILGSYIVADVPAVSPGMRVARIRLVQTNGYSRSEHHHVLLPFYTLVIPAAATFLFAIMRNWPAADEIVQLRSAMDAGAVDNRAALLELLSRILLLSPVPMLLFTFALACNLISACFPNGRSVKEAASDRDLVDVTTAVRLAASSDYRIC